MRWSWKKGSGMCWLEVMKARDDEFGVVLTHD